jgi:hypothetical protein
LAAAKAFGDFKPSAMIGNQIFETNSDYGFIRGEELLLPKFNNMRILSINMLHKRPK